MASSNGPATELVQIPLGVPFSEFISEFGQHLEPVLLAQPGLLSVMTGVTIPTKDGEQAFAVSLTQWDSVESHAAFTNSPDAGPFFARVQPLTTGPPTVEHYYLGAVDPSIQQSRYSLVLKFAVQDDQVHRAAHQAHVAAHGSVAALTGKHAQNESQSASVLFGDSPVFEAAGGVWNSDGSATSFTVQWHRVGTKKISSAL
ncbi:hypothetical protein B0J13DRAFT_625177 [Dactylonectria estremocensis]|uniref:ABM domain-containing protein n=1 Tax=Dactylonectria estremocensis TaxID=1079267 RepID=A0A9P9J0W0_9HYPO|nr:hypothetical protein B0J13DRAFT_625177 [Dactylonectria estremocensis]